MMRGPEANLDKPYVVGGGKSFSRRQIAEEIQNGTEEGINFMSMMLNLAADMMSRNKHGDEEDEA